MRSTLLFVAVLLACPPVHAQSTAPPEAPILTAWLASILPVESVETTRRKPVKRTTSVIRPRTAPLAVQTPDDTDAVLPANSAALLLHSPNAP